MMRQIDFDDRRQMLRQCLGVRWISWLEVAGVGVEKKKALPAPGGGAHHARKAHGLRGAKGCRVEPQSGDSALEAF